MATVFGFGAADAIKMLNKTEALQTKKAIKDEQTDIIHDKYEGFTNFL